VSRALRLSLAALASLAAWSGTARAIDPERSLGEFTAEVWRAREGLPGAWVRAITQTPDGYLWIGTQGGLVRYGGGPLVPLPADRAFDRGRDVMGLVANIGTTVWLVPARGRPACVEGERMFDCFDDPGTLPADTRIADLDVDAEGAVWIAAPGGIYRSEGKRLVLARAASAWNGAPPTAVRHAQGHLWVGTADGLFKGPARGAVDAALELVSKRMAFEQPIVDIARGAGDRLWVVAERALLRVDGDRHQLLTGTQEIPLARLTTTLEDRDGNLWIGSRSGLFRYQEQTGITRFTRQDGLPDDDVSALFEDREGSLWVGMRSGGLAQFSDRTGDRRTGPPSLRSQWISAVAEEDDGTLWAATARGLTRWRDGQERTFTSADGLPADGVLSVHPGRPGELWVGTGRGLARRQGERFVAIPGITAEVSALLFDAGGTLWAGTADGLYSVQGDAVQRFAVPPGLLSPAGGEIRAIARDDQEVLWISANGTLLRLVDDQLQRDPTLPATAAGPPGQGGQTGQIGKVRAIARDADGTLWVGSGDGLLRRRQGRWRLFGRAEGLERTDLFQVATDDHGYLWVGVNHGLLRFARGELEAVDRGERKLISPVSIEILDQQREVRVTRTRQPGVWKNRAGRLRFASSRGVVSIDPRRVPLNTLPPPVRIERALVDGRPAHRSQANRFPPGSGAMEFHFAAITLLDPRRAQHRYRLEGFDRDWVDAGTRRAAYYTNLGPGHYRFRVQGSNADGVWNDTGDALELTLAPHFYQTVWFWGLAVAAALGLALSLHRSRVARLRAFYAATFAERARVARELHDSLLQGMAAALMHLRGVRKRFAADKAAAPAETVARELKEIEQLVSDNIEETRQFVWDLRDTVGQKQNGAPDDAGRLAPALTELTSKLVPPGSLEAKVVVEGDPLPLPRHVQHELLRIAHEAVVNAVQHGQARHLETRLRYDRAALSLSVRDDGRGFDPQGVAEARPGHFGLQGMRERAARLGQFAIESATGQGTTITVNVALKDLRDV
jgi:ligand-binding sensor domain-containing protein/signal transduction histidine kinase